MSMKHNGYHRGTPPGAETTIFSGFATPLYCVTATLAAALSLLSICVGTAWAGPPFRTDDPEPVEYRSGEFYVATQYDKDKGVTSGTAPHFELNYGPVHNVQLHMIAPLAYVKPEGGAAQHGYGDTELGIKYRFLNDEASHFMAGIFPIVELPTGNSDKGLGAGHTLLFLPLWLQKAWGPWQSYGGGGYWRNPGEGNKDYWFFGWQVQREISEMLTLGAELFGNTKTADDGKYRAGFNVGAIINLTVEHHLLFSVGSDLHGDNKLSSYFAYQLTFGPHGESMRRD
jgi:hypothetical protein